MFAVVRSGHRQFKVSTGDLIRVPRLSGEIQGNLKLETLAMEDAAGFFVCPEDLKKASVSARILRHGLGKKTLVFKKKRRKGYRRTKGHRQTFTELRITEIKLPSGKVISAEKSKSDSRPSAKIIPQGKTLKTVKSGDDRREVSEKIRQKKSSPDKTNSFEKKQQAVKTKVSAKIKSGDENNGKKKTTPASLKAGQTKSGKADPLVKARKAKKQTSSKKPSVDK